MKKATARKLGRSKRRPTRAPEPRYHHGDLPRALLDAALRLVETRGTRALTLRAAARVAGVSQAAPYRHFTNKEALLAAVAEDGFRAMAATIREAAAGSGGRPLERLRAVGLGYVGFATSRPSQFRLMFGREMSDRDAHPSLRQAAGEIFQLLLDSIADCQRAGVVRSGEPRDLALTAWSTVHGLSALLIDGYPAGVLDRPTSTLAETVTRDLFFGLGASPDGAYSA